MCLSLQGAGSGAENGLAAYEMLLEAAVQMRAKASP